MNTALNTVLIWQQVAPGQPSVLRIWLLFLVLGGIGFIFCRVRFWLLPLALVIGGAFTAGIISTLRDPQIGAAIVQQAPHYPRHAYAAITTAVALCCLGAYRGWRTRAQTRQ